MVWLRVIEGSADPPKRIAMSFVHPLRRLDFESRDIAYVEASDLCPFIFEGHARAPGSPHIAVTLKNVARAELYKLTCAILASGQANVPLAIWVGDRCVTQPVLRETLGTTPTFFISAGTIEQARERASILASRWTSPKLALVKR